MITFVRVLVCAGLVSWSAPPAGAQPLKDVFRRVNPSVVLIEAKGRAPAVAPGALDAPSADEGLGSGVLISADGKVLTAAHVVQGAVSISVRFLDADPVAARVVHAAPYADLALLQLDKVPAYAVPAAFGNSDGLDVGDQVFTIGAPYGATHSLAVGWVSARRTSVGVFEDATALEVFQTDMAVFEGNSGGPLFNVAGEVVGIVTHVLTKVGGSTGPGFAVTGNVAKTLMIDQRRAWFGVESVMLDESLARALHLPAPGGLLVQSVAEGSLGARLGIREGDVDAEIGGQAMRLGGDVLLEVQGIEVSSTPAFIGAFTAALYRLGPGDAVSIKVWRGGAIVQLSGVAAPP